MESTQAAPKKPSKQQIAAMSALYEALTYIDMKDEVNVQEIVTSLTGVPYEDSDVFLKAALIESLKHLNDIIPLYNSHMNKWTFDRLNRVEQAILLLSYVHYFYIDSTIDKAVVVDIGCNLAHAYLDANDYKFVNAILDKVLVRG